MNAPMWSAVEYDIDKNQISVKGCELSCNGVLICKGSIQEPIMYVFNELYATLEEQKMAIASPVFATKEQCEDNSNGFFESGFWKISEVAMTFLGDDVIPMIKLGEIAKASEGTLEFIKENF